MCHHRLLKGIPRIRYQRPEDLLFLINAEREHDTVITERTARTCFLGIPSERLDGRQNCLRRGQT